MNSLSFTIQSIKNARDVSRISATGSISPAIALIAEQYVNMMNAWIIQLEEVEHVYELNRTMIKELTLDASIVDKQ